MLLRAFAAAALFATGAAALAQDATPTPAPPVKEKKICRTMATTGSIVPKRKCMTKAEWTQLDTQNEQHADRFRDRLNPTGRLPSGE